MKPPWRNSPRDVNKVEVAVDGQEDMRRRSKCYDARRITLRDTQGKSTERRMPHSDWIDFDSI